MIPYPGLVTAIIIVIIAILPASFSSRIFADICPSHFAMVCKAEDSNQEQ